MSMLLNRKYGSRLECLYYILKSMYDKYGINKTFKLGDFKFDEDDDYNVHHYCQQLIDCVGQKCCRFLDNPLDISKCYATQSIDSDSTKSKAVSDIGGSLEALGFITRTNDEFIISENGKKWVNSDFNSKEWEEIALKGVLSYGVVIGFLSKLRSVNDVFSYSGIYLSFPQTEETVEYQDKNGKLKYINISTDSQKDSNTRTMSKIIAWCVSVGLIEPLIDVDCKSSLSHIKYREFLNKDRLTTRKFKKTELYKAVFNSKKYVENPLSYTRLHKDVRALRENGGEDLRLSTMAYNQNILNRRYVFVSVLNYFSNINKPVSFSKLVSCMEKYEKFFFSKGNNAQTIMSTEAEIAEIAGIPFEINGDLLTPLTTINTVVLNEDANDDIKELAEKIIKEMENS